MLVVDRMLPKLDGLSLIRVAARTEDRDAGPDPVRARAGRRPGEGTARRRRRLPPQALRLLRTARPRRGAGAPARQSWRARSRRPIGSPISNSTGCPIASPAPGTRSCLQPREFRLLEYLMKHADQVVTRTMLLEHVWDYHFDPQTNVIDVHVSRLRAKIDKGFDKPLIHTIRGAGYMVRVGGEVERLSRRDPRGAIARARQARPHHGVQAVVRLSRGVRAVRASLALGYVAWNAQRLLDDQIRLDHRGGDQRPCRAVSARRHCAVSSTIVERRSRAPGASLYLVTTSARRAHRRQCRRAAAGRHRQARAVRDRLHTHRRGRCTAEPCARAGLSCCQAGSASWSAATWRRATRLRDVIRRAFGYSLALHRRARLRRRLVHHPPGAEAHRRHDRDHPHHHGRRSRTAA